jgi:hypothetical protein
VDEAKVPARRQQLGHFVHLHDHVAQVNSLADLGHSPAVEDSAAMAAAGDDDAQFADHGVASVSAR